MARRRLVWLIWCLAVGLLYLFENDTGTRILLACSVLLPLMGALAVPIAARHAAAYLSAPREVEKNAAFDVLCTLKRRMPLVRLEVRLQCRNLLTGEAMQATVPMPGRALSWAMRSEHCGLLALEAAVLIQDTLGIFAPRPLPVPPVSIWSMPRLEPLEVAWGDSGSDWDQGDTLSLMPGMDASDPFSFREYIPGDPVRQIHWKLSQKTGTIMLRELRQPIVNQVLLIFDASYPMAAGQAFPEAADAMAEGFLALSRTLLGTGIPHTACWQPAGQPVPTYQAMRSEADHAALMSAFFAQAPERDTPIVPTDFTQYFAHVALFAPGCPDANLAHGFGQQLTIITGEDRPLSSQITL